MHLKETIYILLQRYITYDSTKKLSLGCLKQAYAKLMFCNGVSTKAKITVQRKKISIGPRLAML